MTTPTISQPSLSNSDQLEITNYINTYRAKHSAPPLIYDSIISAFTQSWSFHMASNNDFSHSSNNLYGENIAYLQGYGTDAVTLIKKSIDLWYNEVSLYNFNAPGYSDATGHFTCLVWLASTSFGIGVSINMSTTEAYISFNTYPPGNVIGQFQKNVLPPIGTSVPVITPPVITPPVIKPPVITPPIVKPPVIKPPDITPPSVKLPLDKNKVISQLYAIIYMTGNSPSRAAIISTINQILYEINQSA
uniref:SCP domain-containing protein n=1 Tax=viral metagenome TaxID=1070528 RepID=A0A6C0DQT9_9ZZZZ